MNSLQALTVLSVFFIAIIGASMHPHVPVAVIYLLILIGWLIWALKFDHTEEEDQRD